MNQNAINLFIFSHFQIDNQLDVLRCKKIFCLSYVGFYSIWLLSEAKIRGSYIPLHAERQKLEMAAKVNKKKTLFFCLFFNRMLQQQMTSKLTISSDECFFIIVLYKH